MEKKQEFFEKLMEKGFDFNEFADFFKQKEAQKEEPVQEEAKETKEDVVHEVKTVRKDLNVGNGKVLKIRVQSSDGDKVNINLPLELAKIALKLNPKFIQKYASDQELDLEAIIDMIDQQLVGELVSVQSADNDTVSIIVE